MKQTIFLIGLLYAAAFACADPTPGRVMKYLSDNGREDYAALLKSEAVSIVCEDGRYRIAKWGVADVPKPTEAMLPSDADAAVLSLPEWKRKKVAGKWVPKTPAEVTAAWQASDDYKTIQKKNRTYARLCNRLADIGYPTNQPLKLKEIKVYLAEATNVTENQESRILKQLDLYRDLETKTDVTVEPLSEEVP